MNPSWLIVEYASVRFTSVCVSETTAANKAVTAPTVVITTIVVGDNAMTGLNRTSRKGPAFTIVAA